MKRWKKILVGFVSLLLIGVVCMIAFSPYKRHEGFNYKLIKHTVEINASADSVFRFLGNSANARKWSVYVHHISTLNGDSVPDGMPGSIRRAYCNADESGQHWDEVTTKVEVNKLRQLTTYNYVDFSMTAEGLATEQLYESITDTSCTLTFTLFYLNHNPTWWEELKTYFASYTVLNIYEQNMDNIKRIVETSI